MALTPTDLPAPDEILVIYVRIPGVAEGSLEQVLRATYGASYFSVPTAGAIEAVKSVTLQQGRLIRCISIPRPVGFHGFFAAPVPDTPLPSDGIFAGRTIVHVALVLEPWQRLENIKNHLARSAGHAYSSQAASYSLHDFYKFLAEQAPAMVANQQCQFIAGRRPGPPTCNAAVKAVQSRPFLLATVGAVDQLIEQGRRSLGWASSATIPPAGRGQTNSGVSGTIKTAFVEDSALYRWALNGPHFSLPEHITESRVEA